MVEPRRTALIPPKWSSSALTAKCGFRKRSSRGSAGGRGDSLLVTADESGALKVLTIRNAVRSLRGMLGAQGCSARATGGLPTS
jgi:hypothetical protein